MQFQCVDENPWCFAISEFRSTTAAKGMAMIPKRGLNVMKCETARLLKLTSSTIEPLSFVVPRKVGLRIGVRGSHHANGRRVGDDFAVGRLR